MMDVLPVMHQGLKGGQLGFPDRPFCGPCCPKKAKPAKSYALRDPLPSDCPPLFRLGSWRDGAHWLCDDCAEKGARWFVAKGLPR